MPVTKFFSMASVPRYTKTISFVSGFCRAMADMPEGEVWALTRIQFERVERARSSSLELSCISDFILPIDFSFIPWTIGSYTRELIAAIAELWRERQAKQLEANQQRLEYRQSLQNQIRATVDRIRVVTSETALTYLEEDIISAENELAKLDKEIANQPNLQAEFDQVLQYAKYILEHLPELLLDLCNPLRKATFFAAIFNKMPTYDEIKFGTHKNSPPPEVNELFRIQIDDTSFVGDLTGNRTRIARMKTWCPNR